MVMALIDPNIDNQKKKKYWQPKNKPHFNSIHTGKSLQGKLEEKLTKFLFLTCTL